MSMSPLTRGKKQKVQVLLQQQRLEEARSLLEKICQANSRDVESWYLLAAVNQHVGRLNEAIEIYRHVLTLQPQHVEALYYLGNALRGCNKLDEAERSYRQVISKKPDHIEAHCNLGSILEQSKDYVHAAESYQTALRLDPKRAELHYNLGNALQALEQFHEAIEYYRRAIALQPDYPEAYNNLGNALSKNSELQEETLVCYKRAINLKPDFSEAAYNLGVTLRDMGKRDEARLWFERAIMLEPNRVEAHNDLGNIFLGNYQLREAINCYTRAININPRYEKAYLNLGKALWEQHRIDEAIAAYRQAIQLNPEYVDAHTNLAMALWKQGDLEEALACYRRALAISPNAALQIKIAIALPVIPQSNEEIVEIRQRLVRELMELAEKNLLLTDPASEVGQTSFFLSYHGLNNREIQTQLAQLYERVCPSLLWTAPHCRTPRSHRDRLRIGFISKFMYNHSIGRTTRGLIAELSRGEFEVFVLFVPPFVKDGISSFIWEKADNAIALDPELTNARKQIAELELDALFYQDIGMEPFTYFLAFARLAPVQCVSFGHPDTTGIRNMDYFISNDLFESDNATEHYSEKLFLLNNLGTLAYYYKPSLSQPIKRRGAFGLPAEAHLYICPQALFKFHPDFDTMLAGILRADPRGQLVLIEGKHSRWTELLRQRFTNTGPDVLDKIKWLPPQNSNDFLNLLTVCDVVLDTPYFNGMNTSLEAFAVGTPIVTMPTTLQRGRHTAGMYRKMGIEECVARSPEEYIEIAVRLANDTGFRRRISSQILAANTVLYEDKQVVREFERFFRETASIDH